MSAECIIHSMHSERVIISLSIFFILSGPIEQYIDTDTYPETFLLHLLELCNSKLYR